MIKSASRCRTYERIARALQIIRHDAEIVHLAAQRFEQTAQHEAVRVVDASGRQRLARHHQLVTGEEGRDTQPSIHGESRGSDRRSERAMLRLQSNTGLQHDVAAPDVDAGFTDCLAARRSFVQRHLVANGIALLLHDDRVGSRGNRGAGKNARRGSGLERNAHLTRGNALADAQRGRNAGTSTVRTA